MGNTIHYFWCLCPNDIKDGDTFTVNIEAVTCAECLDQIIPFTDTSPVTPAEEADRREAGG